MLLPDFFHCLAIGNHFIVSKPHQPALAPNTP